MENFAAIINSPQGPILVVVEKGEIAVGHGMKVTLSCDERVVDGAVGAKFLEDVKNFLENPLSFVLILGARVGRDRR